MPVIDDATGPVRAGAHLESLRELVRRGQVRPAVAGLRLLRRDDAASLPAGEQALLLALLMDCYLAQGDLGDAMGIGEALEPHLIDPSASSAALARWARGELASALAEPDVAVDHFLEAGRLLGGGPDVVVVGGCLLPWRAGAALNLVRLGRRREALDLAEQQLALAQTCGDDHDVAVALRALATTESDSRRIVRLREARAVLAGGDSERLRAQIDTDLAGLLVLTGETAEALSLLREAEATPATTRCGPCRAGSVVSSTALANPTAACSPRPSPSSPPASAVWRSS